MVSNRCMSHTTASEERTNLVGFSQARCVGRAGCSTAPAPRDITLLRLGPRCPLLAVRVAPHRSASQRTAAHRVPTRPWQSGQLAGALAIRPHSPAWVPEALVRFTPCRNGFVSHRLALGLGPRDFRGSQSRHLTSTDVYFLRCRAHGPPTAPSVLHPTTRLQPPS